jgi:hypothetical protein
MLQAMPNGQNAEVTVPLGSDGEPIGGPRLYLNAGVPNAASISFAQDIKNATLAGVQLPGNLDGATTVTFQVSNDGGATYSDMYDETGQEFKLAGGAALIAGKWYALPPYLFAGIRFFKFRLGTAAAPVVATADRFFNWVAVR